MPPERSPPRNRFKAAKLYCCFFSTRFQCKSRCQTAAGFTDTKILAAAAFQNWSSYLKSKQEKWNSKMEELLNKFFFISSPRLRLLSKEAAEVKVDSLRRARRQKKTSKGRERRTRGEKKCLLSLILSLSCPARTVHVQYIVQVLRTIWLRHSDKNGKCREAHPKHWAWKHEELQPRNPKLYARINPRLKMQSNISRNFTSIHSTEKVFFQMKKTGISDSQRFLKRK